MKCHPNGYHFERCFSAERDLAEARALLARWDAWFNLDPEEDNTQSIGTATRAFLRRAEALECVVCGKQGGCEEHGSARVAPSPAVPLHCGCWQCGSILHNTEGCPALAEARARR